MDCSETCLQICSLVFAYASVLYLQFDGSVHCGNEINGRVSNSKWYLRSAITFEVFEVANSSIFIYTALQ